ncbi:MAG: hypothetical protein AB2417_18550 [Clostridiaceae bacterium]
MYAEKSSQTMNYPQNMQCHNINKNIVRLLDTIGDRGVTISYVSQKINNDQSLVFKAITELQNKGIIKKIYSSRCPICTYENVSETEDQLVVCNYCKESYYPHDNNERFKMSLRDR